MIEGRTGAWEIVIGLEVHAQVVAKAKLFSGAATDFGAEPNTQVSPVDAAFPGHAAGHQPASASSRRSRPGSASTPRSISDSVFDRKNYFYPDLPAGYQISQYQQPVVGQRPGHARHAGRLDPRDRHHPAASRAGCRQEPARPAPEPNLCRPQPRRRRADGDRLRARSAQGRGGRSLSAQIALDPALSRHLRRQHGGGLAALRLQRLGAPAPASRSARAARSRT